MEVRKILLLLLSVLSSVMLEESCSHQYYFYKYPELDMFLISPKSIIGNADDGFLLMFGETAVEGGEDENEPDLGAFTMGALPDNGTLSNVAPYVFVESGGAEGFTYPYSAPETVDALNWESGPFPAGDWILFIEDAFDEDLNSIGEVKIKYCGECD